VRWPSDYIAGVVRRNGGFVVIVDLARLFSGAEVAMMGSAGRLAATA
jgi:purine-binding chemotaxis protein CheW